MKRIILLLSFLTVSFWLWSQSFTFRDPAFVAGLAPSSGAVAPWVPTDISACILWLAADQTEFTGYTNHQEISVWTDHSANAKHFYNSRAIGSDYHPKYTNNVVNGKPAIYFDGFSTYLTNAEAISTSTNYTIFAVHKLTGTDHNSGTYAMLFDSESGRLSILMPLAATCTDIQFHTYAVPSSVVSNIFTLYEFVEGAATLVWTNGVQAWTTNAVTKVAISGTTAIGTSYSIARQLHGELAEFIIYGRTLSADERTQVRTNLNSKYALWTP